MGASMSGARAFTASSANGLAYMAENIMVAGYYRLPIVMVAVNRTLGPPWNIWADQGDTLMLRDLAWLQFYCENNQEVLDTTLLAFRLAEDRRILLPVMTCMDAFIVSHTQMETSLPEQAEVDRYLPDLDLPHRMHQHEARTMGGLAWPHEGLSMRLEIDEAMRRVPAVYQECRESFKDVFGRDPGDVIHVLDAAHGLPQQFLIRHAAPDGHDVEAVEPLELRPHQAPHLAVAAPLERLDEVAADEAGAAGYEGLRHVDFGF